MIPRKRLLPALPTARPAGDKALLPIPRIQQSNAIPSLRTATLCDRVQAIVNQKLSFIYHRDFSDPEAADRALTEPVLITQTSPSNRPHQEKGFHVFPQFDYATQLALFRRMNFVKFLAHAFRLELDLARPDRNSVEQIEALIAEAQYIRGQLTESNLPFVFWFSGRFVRRYYPRDEIQADANLSLLRAVDHFDYSRGFRFTTYAANIIGRDLNRNMLNRRQYCVDFAVTAPKRLTTRPDLKATDLSKRSLPLSYASLLSLIPIVLNQREQRVISLRFGLEPPHEPHTRAAIGKLLSISAERVRQLELQAIERLQAAVHH